MVKANATTDATKGGKMFSADVVATVLYSTGTTSLSNKNYELMSALDGSKTASGFQHDFRAVLAKARELKKRAEDGEEFKPMQPTPKKKGGEMAAPASTPRKRKNASDSDEDGTPSKKKKLTPTPKPKPKSRSKKTVDPMDDEPTNDAGDGHVPQDAEAFIRHEQTWEYDFS